MIKKSTPTISHFVAQLELTRMDDTLEFVEEYAEKIVDNLGFHCVEKISHKFSPQGVTLCYILSESHLVIHTWPEYDSVHIDLFTCSSHTDTEFEDAIKSIFSESGIVRLTIFQMTKQNGN